MGPTNLVGGSFYDRQQQAPVQAPPKVHEVPAAPPAPAAPPLLSIAYPNFCTLSRALLAQLGNLSLAKARFHVVVPALRGGQWYLDTNPKPGVGASLPPRGRSRFRMQPVPKMHFQQSRPLMNKGVGLPFKGFANVFVTLLHFSLGEQVAGYPGYYLLEPIAGPVHQ